VAITIKVKKTSANARMGAAAKTVSRKSQGGAAQVGTGSGNKSGGDGKKAVEHHRKDNSGE
jgi:hypothetical protein